MTDRMALATEFIPIALAPGMGVNAFSLPTRSVWVKGKDPAAALGYV